MSIVKRLLKKYAYPPDQAKKALEIVMHQAELMAIHTEIWGRYIQQPVETKDEYGL